MKRQHLSDGDTFEHGGLRFMVHFDYDDDCGAPWENSDGHGPVRKSSTSHRSQCGDKRRGERPLNAPGRNEWQFYYDWQAACKLARRDGWNAEPYDAPNRIERAVKADFDFLSAWCTGEWEYVCVTVARVDAEGEETGEHTSLGMVETWRDYHVDVAYELAEEIRQQARRTWRAALREARERKYWNARDVATSTDLHA